MRRLIALSPSVPRGARYVAAVAALVLLSGFPGRPSQAQPPTPAAELRVVERREIRAADVQVLAISPDGRWLAGMKDVPGPEPLCVYATDTLFERACADLSGLAAGLWARTLVWSPDGAWLAFAEDVYGHSHTQDGDLWVMAAASGRLVNLTDDGYAGDLSGPDVPTDAVATVDTLPAWSPDGRTLAFSRTVNHGGEWRGNAIGRIGLDGGEPETVVRLSDGDTVVHAISWADGQRLLYTQTHFEDGHSEDGVWLVGADGSDARQLRGPDPVLDVRGVAATGDHALVVGGAALGLRLVPAFALLDLTTGAVSPIPPVAGTTPRSPIVVRATFSPDGRQLLYVVAQPDSPWGELMARDVDGSAQFRLADEMPLPDGLGLMGGLGISWAADGAVLVPEPSWTSILLRLESGPAGTPAA